MAKNTMGTKLPRKLEQKMQIVGEQIKLARLRRNLSVAQVAERATCSPLTVSRIEKGIPTVAIGIYLRVLYALQLDDDILWQLPSEAKSATNTPSCSLNTIFFMFPIFVIYYSAPSNKLFILACRSALSSF